MVLRFSPALVAAALLLATAATAETLPAAETAKKPSDSVKASEEAVLKAAPHAAQIQPMVGPVQRVAPKVPETKEKPAAKTAKKTGGGTDKGKIKKADAPAKPSRATKAVPSNARNDDCAKGFKLSGTGNTCVKVAVAESAKNKTIKTTAAKKKHR